MADNTIFLDPSVAIISRFDTEYPLAGGLLPRIIDNDDGQTEDLSDGFINLSIRWISSAFNTINGANPQTRRQGQLNIEILTKINEGPGEGLSEAGIVAEIFRGQSFSDMLFFDPSIETIRRVERPVGQMFETPLICPFQHDKHVTIL